MSATYQAIAEAAGVSIGTVERVLNNRPNVREETRQRVLIAAEQLGFRRRRSTEAAHVRGRVDGFESRWRELGYDMGRLRPGNSWVSRRI